MFAQIPKEYEWIAIVVDRFGFSGAGFAMALALLWIYGRQWFRQQIRLNDRHTQLANFAIRYIKRMRRKERAEKKQIETALADARIHTKDVEEKLERAEREVTALRTRAAELEGKFRSQT